jgi:hypothetical protein
MTEEEARNKICPKMIARMYLDHRSGATEYDYSYCIASDCMMWEWKHEPFIENHLPTWKRTDKGCCGLGGKP